MLGRSRLPSLAKEGWTRHQEISPFLLKARTGWFVRTPKQFLLNEPPRLRPLRWLREIFLMGAATPPFPRRGIRFKPSTSATITCVSFPGLYSCVLRILPICELSCRQDGPRSYDNAS